MVKGDRVAAYGRNSDAYLLLFLACAKAGLVHVPVNYALSGDELFYIIHQSGSRALFYDPPFEAKVNELRTRLDVEFYGTLREGHGLDTLEMAHEGPLEEVAVELEDTDLAQLLYTSGTTSTPKGAMLSHRALIHEYMSCVVAFDLSPQSRPLHAFPLYHSAQMHGFILPHLMIGATNWLMELPEAAVVLSALETFGITSFFAPPTFWIALLHHPEFARKDLSSLGKVFYGASIMPTPVLQQLRGRFPGVGFYNAFGQSEIAPVATVLRPEDYEARPDSAGKPVLFVEMRVVDQQMRDVAPGESGEVVYRSPQLCSG